MPDHDSKKIYQFKITLKEVRPPIWRRIQVPSDYTFWDLHVAIQDAMGWTDSHLHAFHVKRLKNGRQEEIGIPDEEGWSDFPISPGWERKISHYFSLERPHALYEYDFGDGWQHDIRLEKILALEEGVRYPRCVKGKRACPPEDCGGPWGYEDMLKVILDAGHEEYESTMEWLGGEFDPERFDPEKVVFDDPQERWSIAFSEDDEDVEGLDPGEDDDVHKVLWEMNRQHMHSIWEKAKAGHLEDLSEEESLLARIMLEHEEEFFNDFEFSDVLDAKYDPEEGVNPFLHICIHSVVENQLSGHDPMEAFQFYNAMRNRKCSHHEAIHLIGAILAPLMFSTLKDALPFDTETYRDLLRKYKTRNPGKIGQLLEKEPKLFPSE